MLPHCRLRPRPGLSVFAAPYPTPIVDRTGVSGTSTASSFSSPRYRAVAGLTLRHACPNGPGNARACPQQSDWLSVRSCQAVGFHSPSPCPSTSSSDIWRLFHATMLTYGQYPVPHHRLALVCVRRQHRRARAAVRRTTDTVALLRVGITRSLGLRSGAGSTQEGPPGNTDRLVAPSAAGPCWLFSDTGDGRSAWARRGASMLICSFSPNHSSEPGKRSAGGSPRRDQRLRAVVR